MFPSVSLMVTMILPAVPAIAGLLRPVISSTVVSMVKVSFVSAAITLPAKSRALVTLITAAPSPVEAVIALSLCTV